MTEKKKEKLPKGWEERVGGFAKAVGKTIDEVNQALNAVAGEPSEMALEALADDSAAPFEDIQKALAGLNIPSAILRKNVTLLRGPKTEEPASVTTESVSPGVSLDILPSIPDNASFISALKAGGELKVDKTVVLCAVKVALAQPLGLFDLPEKLKKEMESFAETNQEPCGEEFYELRKMIVKRDYAEVLSAIGIEGAFVTVGRKNSFIQKLTTDLWPALYGFQKQLSDWQQAWLQGSGNPAMLATAIVAATSGGQMPAGMMAPPDTSPLRDAAESVIDQINGVFAGVGIPIARALAYDAERIKEVLENPKLPATIGTANREQMLRKLSANVTPDYVRLEMNLARYALSIMELPKIGAGQQENLYLGAMLQLGLSIPWDKLGTTRAGIGSDQL